MTTFIIIFVCAILLFLLWQVSLKKYFFEGYNEGNSAISKKIKVDLSFEDSLSNEGKYLVLDTETTGFPRTNINDFDNLDNWPRIVQFAWLLFDEEHKIILNECHIVKQFKPIPPDAIRIHGITDKRASKEGKEITYVLSEFQKALNRSQIVIAHNIDFDVPIVDSEFIRAGFDKQFNNKTLICTMKSTIDFCKLGRGDRYKFPKLSELYQKCYFPESRGKMTLLDAHNALIDAGLTAKCFFKLKEMQVINDTRTSIVYDKRTKDEKEKDWQLYLANKRDELCKPYRPKADYTLEFNSSIKSNKLKKGDSLKLVFEEKETYMNAPTDLLVRLATLNDEIIGQLTDISCIKPVKAHLNGYNLEITFLGFYNNRYVVSIHPVKRSDN